MALNLERKKDNLVKKQHIITIVEKLYANTERDMNWDSMKWHEPDENHEEHWFTEYSKEDSYNMYQLHEAYKEVLDALERIVEKL